MGVVPYLDGALDLTVDVSARLEFIDHVLPAASVLAGAALLFTWTPRGEPPAPPALLGAGLMTLGPLWAVLTHAPLVVQAVDGEAPVGPTVLHALPTFVLLALGIWCVWPLAAARRS